MHKLKTNKGQRKGRQRDRIEQISLCVTVLALFIAIIALATVLAHAVITLRDRF